MYNKQGGLSLIELMIAAVLSLMLLALILTAFSSLSQSSKQSRQLAFLQQNGQLALNLLYNELYNTGFFGGLSLAAVQQAQSKMTAPAADCLLPGIDSGSFPATDQDFLNIFAATAQSGRQLNCLTNLSVGSEYIQIKRALGAVVLPAERRANRFYLEANWSTPRFISELESVESSSNLFPYQHIVLYIQQQQWHGQSIPVLMRKRLIRNSAGLAVMHTDSVIDGVERLHFEFILDSDLDGKPDTLLATSQMRPEYWLQQSAVIVGVTFYLLLRTLEPDHRYLNERKYQMGSVVFNAPADHYRRLMLSGAVMFDRTVSLITEE